MIQELNLLRLSLDGSRLKFMLTNARILGHTFLLAIAKGLKINYVSKC